MPTPVMTAATALDAAVANFNTAVASYISACATSNTAYRVANPSQQEKASLSDPALHLRGILGQNAMTAAALVGITPGGGTATFAAIHAND